jgi:hypothetical protein
MTRREFAINVMRKGGSSEETIQKTLEIFISISPQSSIVFFDTEMTDEREKELVRRMFALPFNPEKN